MKPAKFRIFSPNVVYMKKILKILAKNRNVLKYSENSSRRSVTDKMATASKPFGFFLSKF